MDELGWGHWEVGGVCRIVRFVPISAPQSVGIILLVINIVLVKVWLVGLSFVLVRSDDEESVQPT
jgi:hypothetical protein